jgi:DNA-binding MarR family transcriptional regulator
MISAKDKKVEETLNLINKVFIELMPTAPQDLQFPDLTMKQFRIAMILFIGGSKRMSCIAHVLGVSTPTATGIVDRLVEHDIVRREHDLDDRRAVICQLSPHGKKLLNRIWQSYRNNTRRILLAIPEGKFNLVNETLMVFLATGKTLQKNMGEECNT